MAGRAAGPRYSYAAFYLGLIAFAAWYTFDLEQKNNEAIFMTEAARARYESFAERVTEPGVLVARTQFSDTLPDGFAARHREELQRLHALPNISVIGPTELAPLSRATDVSRALPRLVTDNALSFVVVIDGDDKRFLAARTIQSVQENAVFTEGDLSMSGLPYVSYLLDERSKGIKTTLFPAMFAVAFAILLLCVRRLRAAVELYVPALGSFFVTLALVAWWYGTMNMVTSIVPVLTLVLTLTLGLQLWGAARELGSMRAAFREKARPIALTVVTTGIGFGSLHFSEIPAIRQFADLSFVSLFVCTGLGLLWIAAVARPRPTAEAMATTSSDAMTRSEARATRGGALAPALVCLVVLVIAVVVAPRIDIDTDAFRYFSDELQESFRSVHDEVLGVPVLEILVADDAWANDRGAVLAAEAELETTLGAEYPFLSWRVLVDTVGRATFGRALSKDGGLAATVAYAALPPSLRQSYPAERYRITVFGQSTTFAQYQTVLDRVARVFDGHSVPYDPNGLYYNLMHSQNALVATLIRSFSLTLLVISLLFLIVQRQLRVMLAFAAINVLPIAGGLIFVWAFGFSLNVATVMVFSVALGIAVDSTLHVIHGLQSTAHAHYERATQRPILFGGVMLIPSFAVFGVVDFVPIREFGVTLAATLALALVFDLWALPRFLGSGSADHPAAKQAANEPEAVA